MRGRVAFDKCHPVIKSRDRLKRDIINAVHSNMKLSILKDTFYDWWRVLLFDSTRGENTRWQAAEGSLPVCTECLLWGCGADVAHLTYFIRAHASPVCTGHRVFQTLNLNGLGVTLPSTFTKSGNILGNELTRQGLQERGNAVGCWFFWGLAVMKCSWVMRSAGKHCMESCQKWK